MAAQPIVAAAVPPWAEVFVRRLRSLLPLREFEAEAIASLVREPVQVPGYHQVHECDRPAGEAMVLLRGLACHYRLLDSARRQMTGFVTPGDFCDYGFLSSSPVRQSVMTLGPSIIGRIDLGQLSALASRLPNVVLAGMRAASVEQASSRELVISLGARDALQRLAHLLCELYTRLQVVGLVSPVGQFDLALTQAELGEALGLSTVHVNRTIQQLRRQNLITMGHGQVTVRDFAGLAEVADFDPRYLKAN
jgi:CRP-like cAMP-binding protein